MLQAMSALLISTARWLIDLPVMRRDSTSYITFHLVVPLLLKGHRKPLIARGT